MLPWPEPATPRLRRKGRAGSEAGRRGSPLPSAVALWCRLAQRRIALRLEGDGLREGHLRELLDLLAASHRRGCIGSPAIAVRAIVDEAVGGIDAAEAVAVVPDLHPHRSPIVAVRHIDHADIVH